MTQSIIVYRNPMEAAFWEMMSNGQMIPVIMGVIVFFLVFLGLNILVEHYTNRFGKARRIATNVSMALGAIAGVAIAYNMWL